MSNVKSLKEKLFDLYMEENKKENNKTSTIYAQNLNANSYFQGCKFGGLTPPPPTTTSSASTGGFNNKVRPTYATYPPFSFINNLKCLLFFLSSF